MEYTPYFHWTSLIPERLAAQWIVGCTLFVLILWARWRIRAPGIGLSTSALRQIDFVLVWAVGTIILMSWGSPLFGHIMPLSASSETPEGFGNFGIYEAAESLTLNSSLPPTSALIQLGSPEQASAAPALVVEWSALLLLLYLFLGDGSPRGFHARMLEPH